MRWTGVKMSKLFTLPGIIPAKLNHFLPLLYKELGPINPCPSHHLSPDPSKYVTGSRDNAIRGMIPTYNHLFIQNSSTIGFRFFL